MLFVEEFKRSFFEVVDMIMSHINPGAKEKELAQKVQDAGGKPLKSDWVDPFEDLCDGEFYRKYKFSQNHGETKLYTDYYDPEIAEDDEVIILELTLKQDSIKTVSERSATEILDFLGDIGGFQGALIMIFMFFG